MLKAVVCDEGTAALQRASVVRVAAQQAGYFEYNFFLGYFFLYTAAQSVCRQIKLKIDPFTNVYYTCWNVYLAT